MPITKQHLSTLFSNYKTDFPEEIVFLDQISAFVSRVDYPCSRETLEGHITASAWILSNDKSAALLILHNKLNRWFQPGGHIEDTDSSVLAACKREAIEETGLKDIEVLSPQIFDIDIHTIPERKGIPEHIHYDVRYAFIAHSEDFNLDITEVNGAKWVKIERCVDDSSKYGSIVRMAQKTLSL